MDRKMNIPKVKELLVTNVVAFRPDFTSLDAIKAFNEHGIASAPVVNEKNEVIGYLSESDVIKCMSNCLFFDEQRNPHIDSIMATNVKQADSEWDVFELESFFERYHIRTAPVVDDKGQMLGIITRRDALKALDKIMSERMNYKKDIKTPIELDMRQKIKMIINNS